MNFNNLIQIFNYKYNILVILSNFKIKVRKKTLTWHEHVLFFLLFFFKTT